jgi:hypothetical protein
MRALARYVPADEKTRPEPPKPARKPPRRLTPAQRQAYAGKPSWNHQPKRDWAGPDLPPTGQIPTLPPTEDHDDLEDLDAPIHPTKRTGDSERRRGWAGGSA